MLTYFIGVVLESAVFDQYFHNFVNQTLVHVYGYAAAGYSIIFTL